MLATDQITVSADVEVWRAVLRALRASQAKDPFYHALVLEVESALDDWHKAQAFD